MAPSLSLQVGRTVLCGLRVWKDTLSSQDDARGATRPTSCLFTESDCPVVFEGCSARLTRCTFRLGM